MHPSDGEQYDEQEVASPFSAARARPPAYRRTKHSHKIWKFAFLVVGALVVCACIVLTFTYLNDPYRGLEEFPSGRYFDGFQELAGLKFRSHLRVEADLGWKDGVGRLMVFTPNGETRQLAIFVPPSLSGVFFNKGQNYIVELEVKDGGLIYADSCRKD